MSVPVISIAQMRSWEEATWRSGRSVETVMRMAGRAVADAARAMTRSRAPVLVLAGKGNNGGDARYAAEYLADRDTTLIDCADESTSVAMLREAVAGVVARDGVVIDGLFGIGLNRAPAGRWAELIDAVNKAGPRVLAVDIPSGLLGDDGTSPGATIIAATTLTFGAPKHGLLAPAAESFVGRLEVAPDIGLVACPFAGDIEWSLNSDFADYPPRRSPAGHKGTYGHVALLAGSNGYHGAAVLAARGAQRAMPGLISVYPTERAYLPVAAQLRQAMVQPWMEGTKFPEKATALLIGPGLAGPDVDAATVERVGKLWRESPLAMVVDASALDWLEPGGDPAGIRVVTPHPGEAARMLGASTATVQADRIAAAHALVERFRCVVVLKGHRTVIAGDTGTTINGTGNPHLAQGGSGDVLAGFLAGLLAQPLLRSDVDRLVRFAVHQHGMTADRLTRRRRAWDLDDFARLLGNA